MTQPIPARASGGTRHVSSLCHDKCLTRAHWTVRLDADGGPSKVAGLRSLLVRASRCCTSPHWRSSSSCRSTGRSSGGCSGSYVIRMFGVTAGYHRYFSHRSYKLGRVAQFVMAVLAQTSGQKGVLWWAAHHRDHHRHVRPPDGRALAAQQASGGRTSAGSCRRDTITTIRARVADFGRYPELRWLDRYHWVPLAGFGARGLAVGGCVGVRLGLSRWRRSLLYHATFAINSVAHIWGTRPFATADDSRNNLLLALVTLGEGWHNNHHHCRRAAGRGSGGGRSTPPTLGCCALLGGGSASPAICGRSSCVADRQRGMKHIAVIGAGISGLAAAYLLSRRHRVSLFEREPRLGGHTHTITVDDPRRPGGARHRLPRSQRPHLPEPGAAVRRDRGRDAAVGHVVLRELSLDRPRVQQPRHRVDSSRSRATCVRLGHYRLLRDIIRFNREAPAVLDDARAPRSWTLGGLPRRRDRYSDAFVFRYLVPMASAIWSSSFDSIRRFPAQTLVRFMQNHGMLSVGVASDVARRRTAAADATSRRLIAPLGSDVHAQRRLLSVRTVGRRRRRSRSPIGRRRTSTTSCSPATAIRCCRSSPIATDAERDVLGAFHDDNERRLAAHRRAGVAAIAARARASWNYRLGARPDAAAVGDLRPQPPAGASPVATTYCVTLNPRRAASLDRR